METRAFCQQLNYEHNEFYSLFESKKQIIKSMV